MGDLEVEVSWNLVADNYAGGSEATGNSGGGMWFWETDAWVHHNTVVGNTGDGPNNAYGGGIWCVGGATPILRNNLTWQNTGGDGVGSCGTWWQSDGNIADDPYFCDMENGDYTVAANSGVMTHPAGPLGAFYLPGCGKVDAQPTAWGRVKALYR
jgi:hypothetical protein